MRICIHHSECIKNENRILSSVLLNVAAQMTARSSGCLSQRRYCPADVCFPPQEDPACSERLSGSVRRYTDGRERCAGASGLSAEAVPLCVHKNRNASRGLWTAAEGAGLMHVIYTLLLTPADINVTENSEIILLCRRTVFSLNTS